MPLPRRLIRIALATVAALLASPRAVRGDARVQSYALVIGSNQGGDGQAELRYAVQDARRVGALLRELGRTPADHIAQLDNPDAAAIERALAQLSERLGAHAAAGEQAQLLFYYSGHARANALSLGGRDELPLSRLRASLMALPSTLTVVVLDACQSGAFSDVKGAYPAADFSVQSVQDLHNTGVAVMASSTGSELSQESSELGASYFTHHLLVSLRGAGDRDRNGRVSLDEAYAYAYQHTLSDTARTQVGSQHATLETALTARGDVPLSYPVDADAQLALSGSITGKILVQQRGYGAVMAELIKAAGAPLLIALPSGDYEVLVRGERSARSCEVRLSRGAVASLAPEQCEEVPLPEDLAKTASAYQRANSSAHESWFLELGFNFLRPLADDFTRRLNQFGMSDSQALDFGFDGAAGYMFSRYLGVALRYGVIDNQNYYSNRTNETGQLLWRTRALTLGARVRLPLWKRRLVLFGEGAAGLAFTDSEYTYGEPMGTARSSRVDDTDYYGAALRALVGLDVGLADHFGVYGGAGYTRSWALENELDETRLGGAFNFTIGLRLNGVLGVW